MFRCCILPLLVVGSFVTTALAQSSADVKLVQQKLAEYGAGKADGAMGRNTRNAIRAYQKDWRLPETGKITPDLILRLKREHPRTKSQWFKVSGMNCEVWNSYPKAQEAVTWSGECVSGKANGNGTLVWSWIAKGEEKKSHYEGALEDGKKHGRGVYTWADGNRYDGEYKDGKKHGRGVYTWADGTRYDGEFKNDNFHGRGVKTWADGDRYDGAWKGNKRHGYGVLRFASGNSYEGEWKADKPHGIGTYIPANGRPEKRTWRNGCSKLNGHMRSINTTKKACGF